MMTSIIFFINRRRQICFGSYGGNLNILLNGRRPPKKNIKNSFKEQERTVSSGNLTNTTTNKYWHDFDFFFKSTFIGCDLLIN